jgi:DNA invertase Pin-like site-specific DNA recombinase
MSQSKVKAHHLQRKAVIYIRQSSLHQVHEHEESKRQQYQLVSVAQSLGWAETDCEIIDDDQAISAAQSYNRPGYQRLTAMVVLREVGLIVGFDVGRLARNCLELNSGPSLSRMVRYTLPFGKAARATSIVSSGISKLWA